jgi:hypothetical protein
MPRPLFHLLIVLFIAVATTAAGATPCRCSLPADSSDKPACCRHKNQPDKPCCGQCVATVKQAVVTHADRVPVDLTISIPLAVEPWVARAHPPAALPLIFHPPPPDVVDRTCVRLL